MKGKKSEGELVTPAWQHIGEIELNTRLGSHYTYVCKFAFALILVLPSSSSSPKHRNMSSNPNVPPTTADQSLNELNLRYVVLRILLGNAKKHETQEEAFDLVERYLTYATTKFGNEISPNALQLDSLEELKGYFCVCTGNIARHTSSESHVVHALGKAIGECEAGILAEMGEDALETTTFFEDLAKSSQLSDDEVSALSQGRSAGRIECNRLRWEAAHPNTPGAMRSASSREEAGSSVNTAGSNNAASTTASLAGRGRTPSPERVLSPLQILAVILSLPPAERPELLAEFLEQTGLFLQDYTPCNF